MQNIKFVKALYWNQVSCSSSCNYVIIRPNSGWSSVNVKTLICCDGLVPPPRTNAVIMLCILLLHDSYAPDFPIHGAYKNNFTFTDEKRRT